jgi:hypothetical protein
MTEYIIYINGRNAFKDLGISFPPESINAIESPYSMKPFIENESRDEHGSRIIAHNPRVSKRELTIEMHLSADSEVMFEMRYAQLMLFLEVGKFTITRKGITYKFIFQSCSQFSRVGNIAKFVLKIVEPNPKDRGV